MFTSSYVVLCVIVVNGKSIVYDGVRFESEDAMTEHDWSVAAKSLLKSELKRRNLKYEDLAGKLTAAGHPENTRNLTNKIARGSFTAGFLLECLHVIGATTVRLDDVASSVESVK